MVFRKQRLVQERVPMSPRRLGRASVMPGVNTRRRLARGPRDWLGQGALGLFRVEGL